MGSDMYIIPICTVRRRHLKYGYIYILMCTICRCMFILGNMCIILYVTIFTLVYIIWKKK